MKENQNHQISLETLIEGTRNDLKIAIDDLFNVMELVLEKTENPEIGKLQQEA